jgi:branched-chain amino acid transport system permease protein
MDFFHPGERFSTHRHQESAMQLFFEQLTNGLAVGGIYALIALGYTMVYGVLKLINFAHGDLFTIGAYLGLTLLVSMGLTTHLGPLAGILVLTVMVMGLVAVIGALLERVAYRPLRTSPRLSAVVSALGASIFFQNAIMLIYGARFRVYPHDILPVTSITILGLQIPVMRIILFTASIVMMAGLYFFVQRTRTGTAIRAAAIDQGSRQTHGYRRQPGDHVRFSDRSRFGRCRWDDGGPLLWSDQLHHGLGVRPEGLHRRDTRRYR